MCLFASLRSSQLSVFPQEESREKKNQKPLLPSFRKASPPLMSRCRTLIHRVSCYARGQGKSKNGETFCTNRTRRFKSRVNYAASFFHPSERGAKQRDGGMGGGGVEGANWDARKKKEGKEKEMEAEKNGVRSVTQIQPAAVLQWKHQGGSRTDTEMTRRAQSPSCQKRRLMCTDNFILAPPAATPPPHTLIYIVYMGVCVCVFYFLFSCQPVTCYLSAPSQLLAPWLRLPGYFNSRMMLRDAAAHQKA